MTPTANDHDQQPPDDSPLPDIIDLTDVLADCYEDVLEALAKLSPKAGIIQISQLIRQLQDVRQDLSGRRSTILYDFHLNHPDFSISELARMSDVTPQNFSLLIQRERARRQNMR